MKASVDAPDRSAALRIRRPMARSNALLPFPWPVQEHDAGRSVEFEDAVDLAQQVLPADEAGSVEPGDMFGQPLGSLRAGPRGVGAHRENPIAARRAVLRQRASIGVESIAVESIAVGEFPEPVGLLRVERVVGDAATHARLVRNRLVGVLKSGE